MSSLFPSVELFPFGLEHNDTRAPPADEDSFGPTELSVPIIFYQSEEKEFYVSLHSALRKMLVMVLFLIQVGSNGFITFRNPYTSFFIQPFSSDFELSDPIIAPLWADFSTYGFGSIFYRVTTNVSILHRVKEIIGDANSNYSDYQPLAAIVVTWDSVPPYFYDGVFIGTNIPVVGYHDCLATVFALQSYYL